LEVLHYKALRVAVNDWHIIFPRDMLDKLDHALPNAFAKYALGSEILTTMASKYPKQLYINTIMENHFTTRRNSIPQFFDNSIKKIGQQSIKNRIKTLIDKLGKNWTQHTTKPKIRRYLKKTFFELEPWLWSTLYCDIIDASFTLFYFLILLFITWCESYKQLTLPIFKLIHFYTKYYFMPGFLLKH